MHGFIRKFADRVFYPEEVEILTAAFDDVWARLQASGPPFAAEDGARARKVLAKHIIMAATRGERNRRRLTEDALLHLPLNKLSKMPPARRLSASESEDISLTKEIIS